MPERLVDLVARDGRLARLVLTPAETNEPAERAYLARIIGTDGVLIADAEFLVRHAASPEQAELRAEVWAMTNGWRRKKDA